MVVGRATKFNVSFRGSLYKITFSLGDPPLPTPSLTLSLSLSFTIYFLSFNDIDIY